ncbi:uncharacterized protein V1516DRAFT_669946 [Lipomyces oligophaga]|uniref:uncharacterized protein n=1 Tax=Lipomyces oligophaga TaxID=45792 RepID=UPI0034CF1FE7
MKRACLLSLAFPTAQSALAYEGLTSSINYYSLSEFPGGIEYPKFSLMIYALLIAKISCHILVVLDGLRAAGSSVRVDG